MTHVYVLHTWDGTSDNEGTVRVYAYQKDAELHARAQLADIDHEAVDWTLTEKDKMNGYTMHATYGPDDALVSVRKVPVR
mgnify:CR=1 FL=1